MASKATVKYGSEAWLLKERNKETLKAVKMGFMLPSLGVTPKLVLQYKKLQYM
jgi:hypothetical protein